MTLNTLRNRINTRLSKNILILPKDVRYIIIDYLKIKNQNFIDEIKSKFRTCFIPPDLTTKYQLCHYKLFLLSTFSILKNMTLNDTNEQESAILKMLFS